MQPTKTATSLPFAWAEPSPTADPGPHLSLVLDARKVTQCALSRVCGVCARPLGRPVAFVGTEREVQLNTFHAPGLHEPCALQLRLHPGAEPDWTVVTTSGYEYVRPARDSLERRAVFRPNSLL